MDDVHVSGEPLVAWLAALAFSRHGLAGSVAAPWGGTADAVPLDPSALAVLRGWDLAEDLVRAAPGVDRRGNPVLPADLLMTHVRRRVDGFGLFTAGRRAARLHVSAGVPAAADLALDREPSVAAVQLGRWSWRVAGRLRGWLGEVELPDTPATLIPDVTLRHAGGELPLRVLFDVRLVLLVDSAHGNRWQAATAQFAPVVPLDLVTLGAGGRFELEPADAERLLGRAPGRARLVAPGGELLQDLAAVPPDPAAVLRAALAGAGVMPDVLP